MRAGARAEQGGGGGEKAEEGEGEGLGWHVAGEHVPGRKNAWRLSRDDNVLGIALGETGLGGDDVRLTSEYEPQVVNAVETKMHHGAAGLRVQDAGVGCGGRQIPRQPDAHGDVARVAESIGLDEVAHALGERVVSVPDRLHQRAAHLRGEHHGIAHLLGVGRDRRLAEDVPVGDQRLRHQLVTFRD